MRVVTNVHRPPAIGVAVSERQLLMYALPDTNVLVSASAACETLSNGLHEVTTTWLPCPVCHEAHDPAEEKVQEEIAPGALSWRASAAGVETNSNTWTGYMTKGMDQQISFRVVATNDCRKCICEASTNVVVDVHELSISRLDYLGLDRTDAGRTNPVIKAGTAVIDPGPSGTVTYTWTDCGIYSFTGRTDQATVRYFAPDPDVGSAAYLAEPLTVEAAIEDGDLTASATCTTNFTVVKVDVAIANVGEDKEETEGAFIPYVADATNDVISVEGTNKFVSVALICEPENLPSNEVVRVSCTGAGELYQKLSNGELVRVVTTNYFANEISKLAFVLHGHAASGFYKDGEILIEHSTSSAKDVARYTSVKVNVEITDFPSQKLLGEEKEEIPGAFIPYAADWAFGETPSSDEDIPFGVAAQKKLVNVYVSYEPADLPEEAELLPTEAPAMKFLSFEAPQASLYLAMGTAGVACRWKEFTDWWNSCPPEWSMKFQGKMRLLLHGHEKSKFPRDREIRVTHPRSGATDVAKYTVFHVDLDIDSDNDLSIEYGDGFEDAIEEREPGKIISYDQSGISPGQDYRVPLRLKAWGGETNAVVRLDADSSSPHVAEIYRSETGGDKLDLPFYFPADAIPSLYVDGVTNGTISFTATLINPPEGFSAASSVRPIPGLELAKDKVAALVIQPISFSPSGGAAVWSSIPNDIQDGDGVLFDSIISNQGYKVTWYRDGNGEEDLDIGDCTANAYLNLDGRGAVTIISHGDVDEHLAVYFPYTTAGYNAASSWIADIRYSGGLGSDMTVKDARNQRGRYWYVSVKPRWFEDNWKSGFDRRNSVVLWASCFSSTLLSSCGGRWRSGYDVTTRESECCRVNSQLIGRMNGSVGAGTLRPAGVAYSDGRGSMSPTSVRMEGNPWTTLCPAPIIGTPTFPSSNLSEDDVAFGCLLLDTFVKAKSNMIKVIAGDEVSGIAPLRQEGAAYPFGVGFRIKKGSGTIKVRSEAIKHYIESATPNDEFAPGKTMDADRITPNGGTVEWVF